MSAVMSAIMTAVMTAVRSVTVYVRERSDIASGRAGSLVCVQCGNLAQHVKWES